MLNLIVLTEYLCYWYDYQDDEYVNYPAQIKIFVTKYTQLLLLLLFTFHKCDKSFLKGDKTYNSDVEKKLIVASKRDHRYFAPIYDHYFERIFYFILKRVASKNEADDLTQQVFIKAMMKIGSYEDRGYSFSSWLFRIAINEVNMFYRKSGKNQSVEINESDAISVMAEIELGESTDEIEIMLECLEAMDDAKSQLVELRFMEKKSFKELAEIYGISEASAKMRLYRILENLKKDINSRLGNG